MPWWLSDPLPPPPPLSLSLHDLLAHNDPLADTVWAGGGGGGGGEEEEEEGGGVGGDGDDDDDDAAVAAELCPGGQDLPNEGAGGEG